MYIRAAVVLQVPGRPKYDNSVGVRTRRQAAAHGSGVVRAPTPLPARLMLAVVQLLQQAAAPPEEAADWRELLYGEYSDSGEEGDRSGGGGGGAAARLAVAGDDVRSSVLSCSQRTHQPRRFSCAWVPPVCVIPLMPEITALEMANFFRGCRRWRTEHTPGPLRAAGCTAVPPGLRDQRRPLVMLVH